MTGHDEKKRPMNPPAHEFVPFRPLPLPDAELRYAHGPGSHPHQGVPTGEIFAFDIEDSRIYPGTTRRIWVHNSADHDARTAAPVMIFNDGWWYLDPNGEVRAGIVLDNLIAQERLPGVVSVFVDPGVFPDRPDAKNRNAEYDADDARYADFLQQEVLPRVAARRMLTDDPGQIGICGGSSGGNAAFTAAWRRPDFVRRVIAFNSSFAQMPGGNPYPARIANEERRPLRVFLHAAHRDLHWNEPEENWFAESLETAAALLRRGYDLRLVVGDGGHSPNHGGVLLPDALSWLWR
ncbi:enterochelin esterase [Microbacterium azadirachtae]|uniref:Enterochelin esterase n=2 Tax=Microbacterium azadirachtae TaxID=582680 RepID=A0A1I6GKL1_9MICO|nr:enterochelin esterase [Microbacterium azadirachtae]